MSKILENLKSGYYEVVDNQGVSVTQHFIECLEKEFADIEAKRAEAQKPKEIRFNGFVVDCNYDEARKVLQEDILKMWEENKKLKESEELSNYAKCILKNKKLEEDLELSEKCCVEYEQEIQELKQQVNDWKQRFESSEERNKQLTDNGVKALELKNEKIRELKKQLAEKDEQIKRRIAVYEKQFIEQTNENCELKQQLAEEDKEVKQLKLDLGMFKSVNEFLNRYGIEKAREVLLQTEKTKNQDKISFALEQLEKVKEKLNDYDIQDILSSSSDPYGEFDENCVTTDKINQIIDQQIALLKGKVE